MRTLRAVFLSSLAWSALQAQSRPEGTFRNPPRANAWRPGSALDSIVASGATALGALTPNRARPAPDSYWAIAASAAIPGAGQALLGERRFLPYAAFELFSWVQYAAHARDARVRRDDYRALASTVARGRFSTERPTGDFDYYERLEHYLESGRFDANSGGNIDPESDTSTFNGSIWFLARRTFWKDVNVDPARSSDEWQLAERFYRRRAYHDAYLWSWRNAQLEFDEYRRLIRGANDANRRSVQDLGIIIANHTLSVVDAFVTIRVRRRVAATGERQEVSVTLPFRRP